MRSLWFLLLLEVVSWAQTPAVSVDEKAQVHFRQVLRVEVQLKALPTTGHLHG